MPLVNDQIPVGTTNFKSKIRKGIPTGRQLSLPDADAIQPKFPRIEDCAHFHYESVNYGRIKISFLEESSDGYRINGSLSIDGLNPTFCIRITCKENTWKVRRNLSHFEVLDSWLHECVFDRKFSQLPELTESHFKTNTFQTIQEYLQSYLAQLSSITDVDISDGGQIYCAPVLHWLEMDNHGRNLAPHALGDVADINIPAVAAARVVRRYHARDDDELSLNVGDMVSIIELGASGWWRGKHGFKVGSFPAQCVRRINSANDAVGTPERPFSPPPLLGAHSQLKPIARKHGKFMEFLRSFLDTRPSKSHLKKKGIIRERVFGCDLGELLHRTNQDIPAVVTECIRFVEKHGIVDGIYRISGVSSHIRYLKYEFDSDRRPDLEQDGFDLPKLGHVPGMSRENNVMCDPHSVAGLCKQFFRELPNPLLTYQLYNRFASAVTDYEAEERLLKVHDVIQQLPPPHYRTLRHLIKHLRYMAQRDKHTSMHCRNLAIVWAPNLLRSREIEAGLAAFTEARVQSVVTEFLIMNGDILFSEKLQTAQYDSGRKPPRPRSLMLLPTPKLISLEEAQARTQSAIVAAVASNTLDVSGTGVRMRHAKDSGKQSSNERRKRHHKKVISLSTSHDGNSPHLPGKTSKKQVHRHTASYGDSRTPPCKARNSWIEENTKLTTSHGWKLKLGSLLKKPPQQNQPLSRQGSLRRTRSDDSLVSSHSSQREFSNSNQHMELPSSCLDHTGVFQESDITEQTLPEQVPTPRNETTSISPVRLRDKSRSPRRRSSQRHPRPAGGVYLESDVKTADGYTFQITFRKINESTRKPSQDSIVPSESRLRCGSPFLGFTSDFPSVMGENGLDFDPMSYRLRNVNSPTKKGEFSGIDFNLNAKMEEDVSSGACKSSEERTTNYDESPRSGQNVSMSVKRVESIRSRTEPVFAAVSSIVQPSSFPEGGEAFSSYGDHGLVMTAVGRSASETRATDLMEPTCNSPHKVSIGSAAIRLKSTSTSSANASSNNNVIEHTRKNITQANSLDALTVDSIATVVSTPRKSSAAEQLGVVKSISGDSTASKPGAIEASPITTSITEQQEALQEFYHDTSDLSRKLKSSYIAERRTDEVARIDMSGQKHGEAVTDTETDKTDLSRRISVQFYDISDRGKGALKKQLHRGSFVALVGSNIETSNEQTSPVEQTPLSECSSKRESSHDGFPRTPDSFSSSNDPFESDDAPESICRLRCSMNMCSHQMESSLPELAAALNRSKPVRGSSIQLVRSGYCKHDVFDRGDYFGLHRNAAAFFTPRLDTFNPEGKTRDDYPESYTSLRYSQSFSPSSLSDHGRSPIDDVQLSNEGTHSSKCTNNPSLQTFCLNGVCDAKQDFLSSLPNSLHPRPAPRKHFRSFSAGDNLEKPSRFSSFNEKPKPLPRILYPPPTTAPRPQKPIRHSIGSSNVMSVAQAYERWPQHGAFDCKSRNASLHGKMGPTQNSACKQEQFGPSKPNTAVENHSPHWSAVSMHNFTEFLTEMPSLETASFNHPLYQEYQSRVYKPSLTEFGHNEPYGVRSSVVSTVTQPSTSLSWV